MATALMNLGLSTALAAANTADSQASFFRGTVCTTPKASVLRSNGKPIAVRTTALAKENRDERVAVEKRQNGTPTPSKSQGKRDISPFRAFDLWDPFAPPSSSLVQMLNLMDNFLDDSPTISSRSGGNRDRRTPWDILEDEESFSLRIDMPGLTKEDVKLYMEDNSLVVKGEKQIEEKEEDKWASRSYGKYSYVLALPKNIQTDHIKAELKDGVLYITIPKLKEERKTVDIEIS
ncbi:hypothetical protein O6H91_07G112000 [Diphasiastrum complanatum]|uniref:Uncharacterized protein n=1 Tax=Diphasiastrum complanatum TaxID=34168 RepID=A0ACC2D8N1_DIPCM|nr:hypothetical protein O6H91_07G112000 [Diphasiastrum complanatum]